LRARRSQGQRARPAVFNAINHHAKSHQTETIKGKVVLSNLNHLVRLLRRRSRLRRPKLATTSPAEGLILLAIDVGESKKPSKNIIEQHPRNCKLVMMEDNQSRRMYQANVYSHLRGHRPRRLHRRYAARLPAVEDALRRLVGPRPASNPPTTTRLQLNFV